MSDETHPGPEDADAPGQAGSPAAAQDGPTAAGHQQRALERDIRISQLEEAVEQLRVERAALIEQLREVRPRTGTDAIRHEARQLVKARLDDVRGRTAPEPATGIPLAALPVAPGSAPPRWDLTVDILGDVRPALQVDPPEAIVWDVDVPAGSVVHGAVTLRPGAWLVNRGGVDLILELATPEGEPAGTFVMAVDPTAHARQRQWVPWSFALPAAGRHRLTLRTQVAEGAHPDRAWAVVANPRIEVPGLQPRRRPAAEPSGGPGPGGRAAAAASRLRRALPRTEAAAGDHAAKIALLLPVHDPDPGLLDRTLAAVAAQTCGAWELCIVDDGSSDPLVRDRLVRAEAEDPRVHLLRHEQARGIAGATNAALTLATAEFVATLDHDDLLAPDAIEAVVARLAAEPDTDLLYTDNDILAGDRRFSASLKPGWSPDLMRAVMYTLHLSVYRRSVVEAVGGWRSAFDGAQDHDLVLRLSERTQRIRHLPRVLYHWRAHAGSAALGELAKPLAYERGRDAIAEHLARTGHAGATVERLPQAGRYRVRYPRTEPVTVVLPVRGDATDGDAPEALRALLAALRPDDRIALMTLGGDAAAVAASALVEGAADPRVQHPGAVYGTTGSRVALGGLLAIPHLEAGDRLLVLLECAAAPATTDAIDELAGHVEAGAGGAVGVVSGPTGTLVAGAVDFPLGWPIAAHPDANLDDPGRHPALTMVSDRLAGRGVVATRASTLAPLGAGLRAFDGLALAALTLAISDGGQRVVWSPHARFEVDEAAATELLRTPLGEVAGLDRRDRPDPFWNPQRWPDRGDATVPEAVHENELLDVVDP